MPIIHSAEHSPHCQHSGHENDVDDDDGDDDDDDIILTSYLHSPLIIRIINRCKLVNEFMEFGLYHPQKGNTLIRVSLPPP